MAQSVTTSGDVGDGLGPVSAGDRGSPWNPSTVLSVGSAATGTLDIKDGGIVNSGNSYIGDGDTGVGIVTVDGAGSTWTVNGGLNVGIRGSGTLNITDGGTVITNGAWIGNSNSLPAKTSTVNVDGAGSTWENDGVLFVGGDDYGIGFLNITNGGNVSSTAGRVGYKGSGTVTVTGANSIWTIYSETDGEPDWADDALLIGYKTPGSLTIEDGGEVSVTGGVQLAIDADGVGTLELDGTDGSRGVLEAQSVTKGDGDATVTFDGGVLRAATSGVDLLNGFAIGDVTIDTGGAFIDSNGGDVSISSSLGGAGALTKQGAGTLTLTAANSYAGGTVVETGVLQLSGAGTLGATTGALTVASGATLDLNDTTQTVGSLSGAGSVVNLSLNLNPVELIVDQDIDTTFSGSLSAYFDEIDGLTTTLGLTKSGTGTLRLTGTNNLNGTINVTGGTLLIDGSLAPVYWGPLPQGASPVAVASGGALGGAGSIDGNVSVASGGILLGRSGQTLSMGSLVLDAGAAVNVALGAPDTTGLFSVAGDLTLDGTLNVTNAGGFGEGLYRLFDYQGTLTDDGLGVGATPGSYLPRDLEVQTSVADQVNLVVSAPSGNPGGGDGDDGGDGGEGGGPFIFWDGANSSANGAVDGGSGTWSATGTNWTETAGSANGTYDHSAMLIFAGDAGTVTVDAGALSSLEVSSGGLQFADGGFVVQGDGLSLGAGTTVFRVGDGTGAGADYVATIAANLTGAGGLTKTDLGKLVLTGADTYAGPTVVQDGALAVNGSLASVVTVESGGRLGGSGTVGGVVAHSGATVAPGNSIGTLDVAGDVTFAAGSDYEVETNPAGEADKIAATGTATLQGGIVHVLAGSGNYAPSTDYTILTAAGGRSGQFDEVDSNLAFLTPTLGYGANDVTLTLTRNDISFADVGGTPNQKAAGAGVESLGLGNPIWDAAVQLDAGTARAAFDALSGEIHASARSALIDDSRFVREAALARLQVRGAQGGAIWGRAFGSWGHFDSNGNAARLGGSTSGALLGVDGTVSENVHLGVLGGYSHTGFDSSGRASSGDSDNYHLGAYAGGQWGPLAVRGGLAYTWHRLDVTRSVAFPGVSDTLRSRHHAGTTQAFGEIGYSIAARTATIEPFANLAYVNLHVDGFIERGGAAALTASSGNTGVTFITLGAHGAARLSGDNLKVTGALGWRHAFGDVAPRSRMALGGGDAFTVAGVPIAKDAAAIDAGLESTAGTNVTLGVSYSGQIGSGIADHGVRGSVSVRF